MVVQLRVKLGQGFLLDLKTITESPDIVGDMRSNNPVPYQKELTWRAYGPTG
jgi:hypothetical protein